ncbi:MAG: hypothetical protein AAFP22_23325, partial [Planctomycetota bacterium]
MTPWVEVPIPLRGVGEATASSKRDASFAADSVNVVSIDPQTDQRRLATRPGLVPVGTGPAVGVSERITSLHRVGEFRPLDVWAVLTDEPQEGTVPAQIKETWASADETRYLRIAVGRQDDLFVLREDGFVDLFNPDGALVDTIRPPAPAGT